MNSVRCDRLFTARISSSRKSEGRVKFRFVQRLLQGFMQGHEVNHNHDQLHQKIPVQLNFGKPLTREEVSRVLEGHKYRLQVVGPPNQVPGISRYFKIFQDISRYLQIFTDISGHLQISQDIFRYFRIFRDYIKRKIL